MKNTEITSSAQRQSIPNYVCDECKKCAAKVLSHQCEGSFSIAMFSDFHYPINEETRMGVTHAADALKIIASEVKPDLAVFLGDYIVGGPNSTKIDSLRDAAEITDMMEDAARGIPQLWLNGNHDILPYNDNDSLSMQERFSFIGSKNSNTVTDSENVTANYGYRDFDEVRLRIIYLNTSDIDFECKNAGERMKYYISRRQFEFIINALDLTCKADAEKWKIIFLTHFPVDWPVLRRRNEQGILMPDEEPPQLPIILEDYVSGKKGSIYTKDGNVEYDFTGKNAARITASFNGHAHCLNSGVIGNSGIPRFTVPNASFGRENEYGQNGNYQHGEKNTYGKSINSASDTAFNIVTVDPKNGKIFCDCYGAGYDREISFK